MKRIVFFDIDGTLVDDATRIFPQSAKDAIADLRAKGHLAVISTGRPYTHIDPAVMTIPWDGCVSSCGQEVLAEGKLLYRSVPSPEQCARIRDLIRKCAMGGFYETDYGYCLDGNKPLPQEALLEAERIQKNGLRVDYDPDREDFAFQKFIAYALPGCDRQRFWQEASRDFNLIDRGGGMIEVVFARNTKATGIARILEHFGLAGEDAAAFGDSTNDLAMFACVKTPIAMDGSPGAVQEKAVYVTDTVLEDGIAKGLKWLESNLGE